MAKKLTVVFAGLLLLAYAGDSATVTGAIVSGVISVAMAWLVLVGVRTRVRSTEEFS